MKNILSLCIKHKLTLTQYTFLYCFYFKQEQLFQEYKDRLGYDNKILGATSMEDLINRKFIEKKTKKVLNDSNNELEEIDTYSIGDSFSKLFEIKDTLFEELRRNYPSFITIDGTKVLSVQQDIEYLKNLYYDKVAARKELHEEILLLIENFRDTNMLNMTLGNFISSEAWQELKNINNIDNKN